MAVFDEIAHMQGLVSVLKDLPELSTLGNLRNPDGSDSGQKAILINYPKNVEADYPRVILSSQGDAVSQPLYKNTRQVDNNGTPEYYIDTGYHVTYIISFQVDCGDIEQVLIGNRPSAESIARKIRSLLRRESVRKSVWTVNEAGINSIQPVIPATDLDGNDIVTESVLNVVFTTVDVDTEQVTGVIDVVEYEQTLNHVDETDPNPIIQSRVFVAPDEYLNN